MLLAPSNKNATASWNAVICAFATGQATLEAQCSRLKSIRSSLNLTLADRSYYYFVSTVSIYSVNVELLTSVALVLASRIMEVPSVNICVFVISRSIESSVFPSRFKDRVFATVRSAMGMF